jgi:hypothetical protein
MIALVEAVYDPLLRKGDTQDVAHRKVRPFRLLPLIYILYV